MKYQALIELFANNGIDLVCDPNMEIIIGDDVAKKIDELVENMCPAAIKDNTIINY